MRFLAGLIVAGVFALPAAAAAHQKPPRWVPVPTGSDQQYRGLDAVDKRTAWVGGSDGEVLRTTDGGKTWKDVSPPDTVGLLFRDVEAESAQRASVLAIGPAEASRIYRTTDGGATAWTPLFEFKTPEQGAATATWAATSPQLIGKGGVYCEDCDIAEPTNPNSATATEGGVDAHAIDPDIAARLWTVSAQLTGVDAFATA